MGKGKKASRKRDDDDWENDLEEIAKEAGIDLHHQEAYEAPIIGKKEKKKKNKQDSLAENNDDIMDKDDVVTSKPKASFQALMMDDGDDSDDNVNASDDESKIKTEIQEKTEKTTKQTTKKGKDKKKGKTHAADDDDIDAICAEFELNNVESTKGKKSKKKNKKNDTELEVDTLTDKIEAVTINDEVDDDEKGDLEDVDKVSKLPKEVTKTIDDDDDDDGPKMKTAAQKKAEKKERENKKKEAKRLQKQKEKEKQDKEEPVKESQNEMQSVSETIENDTPEGVAPVDVEVKPDNDADGAASGSDNEGEDNEGTKSKKKKKKKKKKEEDDDKKKKGKKINKAALKQMQEALEMVKQEEERLRLEEEEKAKAFEEAEDNRLEKLRLEQEKKDRKKQKDKEKRERLKKEGKLLTPAQKEQKRRAEQMLEAMRQQGIQVPNRDAGEQKKVKYVTRKPNKKQQQQQQQQSEEAKETEDANIEADLIQTETDINKADVEDSTVKPDENKPEDVEVSEDLPESWDLDSDDEKETETNASKEKTSESTLVKENTTSKPAAVDTADGKVATTEKSTEEESSSSETDSDSSDESDTEDESDSSDSEQESKTKTVPVERVKESITTRILKRRVAAEKNRTQDRLRAPVICVLGHVDTGKTKILDKIRHTNVQDGEAGGITQQIGATMVPVDAVKIQTKMVKEFQSFDLRLPGLLIIDTPGHESFSNLRSRGSNLCDMAILVVDIMHGLEPQTIESINLLRKKQTPFVVALNKVDRLFEWKRSPTAQFEDTLRKQKKNTKLEFEERTQIVINELAEQGLNSALFYKNTNQKSYISLVPTSAHSGDGMGDLMAMICTLTQTRLAEKLAYSAFLESTVMEVKSLPGLGTTIDVILVNGKLKEGDTIITGGIEGPIVTQIRSVLTPQPMRELRVKSQYIHHTEIEAAQGVKLCGKDLERAIAGSPLFVAEHPDEIEHFKREVAEITKQSLSAIKVSERGVYVQASTLGSLEALLEFLKTSKIPYCGVNIGPVHKRDIMRASVMLEHNPMYAVILAFDVKVEKDAQDIADKEGVKVFTADIIYHLFDKFTAFTAEYKQKKRDEFKHIAIFPCKLRVLPQHIYNSRDPIVIGVNVEAGSLRLGTVLTVPCKEFCDIGVVTGIEGNHKQLEKAMQGQEVSIKIEPTGEAPRMYGRHFTHEDMIMSKVSRDGIDALKNYFREEMTKLDWQLLIEMKKIFEIM